MTTLNLGYLATFRLVIQRGSFSAAADVLGISQPAVSLQIRQLEQFLQTRLVERTGRGIKATAAGQALLAQGERIQQAVDDAIRSVSAFSHDVSGTITLGTGATACIHLLPPLLEKMRKDYPLLSVGVTTGNTLDIVRAIEENRLDMGLVTLPVSLAGYIAACLWLAAGDSAATARRMPAIVEEFVFIASREQQDAFRALTPETLHAQPLIAFESGSGTRALIDGWFAAHGVAMAPVMQLGSIEAIKRMVRAGLGYSIVPRMAVEQDADREGLCVMSLTPMLQRQLAVVMRQDKILSKGIAALIRLVQHPSGG